MPKKVGWSLIAGLLVVLWIHQYNPREHQRAGQPLPQQCYLWQRAWTEPVSRALSDYAPRFDAVLVLAAEVRWPRGSLEPEINTVALDYAALRKLNRPVGLVLRVGPLPATASEGLAPWLAGLGAALVRSAKSNSVTPSELQIDFDCPTSKLAEFRQWLLTLRRHLDSTPLTITALPSWLHHREFRNLASAVDSYVLQVHSLERPQQIEDEVVLCDPAAARRAVQRAAQLGKPFRVALPTYSYLLAFDLSGRYIGVSAEGPSLAWPPDTRLREAQSDPETVASLVAGWQQQERPSALRGLLWYRMPVEGDRLNWPWATLESVMRGVAPRSELRVQLLPVGNELFDIQLVNLGTADHKRPVRISLDWQDGRVLASEAVGGFELVERSSWRTLDKNWALAAGQTQVIGWIRFEHATGVTASMEAR